MRKDINGYKIIKQIGTGGFGEVYVAKQEMINREVAIKVILPIYANSPDFIQRFQYEAELVARLEHPHIVPIYDYWRDPDGAYLVMRYIRGGSLASRLTTDGAFSMVAAARLLSQIAGALAVAHRNRVVHQDIKPMNILLDEDGNAYLTDFGIARDIEQNINLAEDETNTMHGSPKYISPEHLRRREITPRSDIYSLGILMYEVLTGQAPFEHEDILKLLQMHVKRELPRLQDVNPNLPEQLNLPLKRATLKDANDRYSDVMDFARDFATFVTTQTGDSAATIPFPQDWIDDIDATGPIEVLNPYKGLSAFQESDAENFFGRSDLIKRLIRAMADNSPTGRFLAVVGASGSGKSSVVRAGLIPALRNGEIMGLPTQYISTMIPSANPVRSLEGAILKIAARADLTLIETINKPEFDLNDVLHQALPSEGEMLLLIDQFEEVFTLVDDEAKRRTFLNMVYDALTAENSRLRLIVTMRADFFDRPLQYSGWGTLFQDRLQPVPAMTTAELREAISGPAENVGLVLQPGLEDIMVTDVNNQIGALPLLQYALTELYEERDGFNLTIDAYTDMEGIRGALRKRADDIFEDLTEERQDVARLLFTRLVRVGSRSGNDTRRRVLRGELDALERDSEDIQAVIDTYGKYRLLTFDNDAMSRLPTVEIAHEALIASWERLSEWIDENRELLVMQSRLSSDTRQWIQQNNDNSFLARGSRLTQYQPLLQNDMIVLTKQEQDFLIASVQLQATEERRRQQIRRAFAVLGVVIFIAAIIATGSAIVAFQERNEAIAARNDEATARADEVIERIRADENAVESRARELAANALLFANTQPDRAMLLALESLAVEDTFEGNNALLTSLLTDRRLQGFLSTSDRPSETWRTVDISPDGSRIAAGGRQGGVTIWDATTRAVLLNLPLLEDRVNIVNFSPDGSLLLTADGTGTVTVWDAETGEQISSLAISSREIRAATFTIDGMAIIAADAQGQVSVWSTDSEEASEATTYTEIIDETAHDGATIYTLALSPDGTLLATGGGDGNIVLWNTDDFSVQQVIPAHTNWVLSLAFSPDGSQLVSGSADQSVRMWDVTTGENLWAFQAHRAEVSSLAYADDSSVVISGGLDARLLIWDAATGNLLTSLVNVSVAEVRSLETRANTLYVASDANTLFEFAIGVQPRFGTRILQTDDSINTTAIHPETGTIAYAGGLLDDFNIYILDDNSTEDPQTLTLHTDIVNSVIWYDDWLISSSADRRVAIWQDGELLHEIIVNDAAFGVAMTDNQLAIGTNRGDILLYAPTDDGTTWEQVGTLDGHTDRVTDLIFSADGSQLISGSRDDTIIVWDMQAMAPALDPFVGHADAVQAVAITPDGSIIASGSRDTTIILWDATTGTPLGPPLQGHENWVNDLDFSPDGSRLVSVSLDTTVINWDVATERQIGLPFTGHTNQVTTVSYAPDGESIITGDEDGNLYRWQTTVTAWRERACAIVNRPISESEARDFFSNENEPANVCVTD